LPDPQGHEVAVAKQARVGRSWCGCGHDWVSPDCGIRAGIIVL
jgi:hypothetical protein